MFVILASWKFCVEKNCDQGLGNVVATPSQLITFFFSPLIMYILVVVLFRTQNALRECSEL